MNSTEIENGTRHIYKNDPALAAIIDAAGVCTIRKKKDFYHAMLRSIIGQQLSVKAGDAIEKKFFTFFKNDPSPEHILEATDLQLRNLGMSWAKAKYVKDLSQKIVDGEIHFRGLDKKTDQQIIEELTKVKGVGVWTVHMFLIFTLCRLDILPVSDLGIRKGIQKLYRLKKLPDEKKMIKISRTNNWSPYNSIASWYLWKSLDLKL
ncbi:MAG: DNA-3-methyladenine glycosylase 2 family protein [Ignavibacteriales bacterium]|nr:MAG: DNA-3-methyladenine glycosylase 2 family protein [Ignavibacteriales bacterium]